MEAVAETCKELSERFTKGVYIMNGNLAYGLGFVLGIVIVSAIILIPMLIALTKDGRIKRKYDERQEAIRGRGFKLAFYTMIIMNMLYGFFQVACKELPIEPGAMVFIIIFMGVGVYAWYTILNDGYFALNERIPQTIVTFTIIGLANLLIGLNQIMNGDIIVDGVITYNCVNLVSGIFMLITVLVILIKQHKDKKED